MAQIPCFSDKIPAVPGFPPLVVLPARPVIFFNGTPKEKVTSAYKAVNPNSEGGSMSKNAVRLVMVVMLFLGVSSTQLRAAGPCPPPWPPSGVR